MSDPDKRAICLLRAAVCALFTAVGIYLIIKTGSRRLDLYFSVAVLVAGGIGHLIAAHHYKEDPEEAAERIYEEARIRKRLGQRADPRHRSWPRSWT